MLAAVRARAPAPAQGVFIFVYPSFQRLFFGCHLMPLPQPFHGQLGLGPVGCMPDVGHISLAPISCSMYWFLGGGGRVGATEDSGRPGEALHGKNQSAS